jgi:single-strand DNA-binding protein
MADTTVTVVGNLTQPPELRFTNGSNKAVCNLRIACNRLVNRPGEERVEDTSFFNVTTWDSLATNVSELKTGDRIVVSGRLQQRSWEQENPEEGGEPIKRSTVEIVAEEVGASMRWASVTISKNAKRSVDDAPAPIEASDEPF